MHHKLASDMIAVPKDRWERKMDNAPELIKTCILALWRYNESFYKKNNILLPFDPAFLLKVIDVTYNDRLERKQKKDSFAILVYIFIIFGCSRNQAIDAFADWSRYKKTTIRTAYEGFLAEQKIHFPKGVDFVLELTSYVPVILDFLNRAESKKFPKNSVRHKKAHMAFKKIRILYSDEEFIRLANIPISLEYWSEVSPKVCDRLVHVCKQHGITFPRQKFFA